MLRAFFAASKLISTYIVYIRIYINSRDQAAGPAAATLNLFGEARGIAGEEESRPMKRCGTKD